MDAKKLLADVLLWDEAMVDEAIAAKNNYRTALIPKRSGSFRTLQIPDETLKRFQRRLLHYFLCRIGVSSSLMGFRQGSSHVSNARIHARKSTLFVLRLDFKDAFPSLKSEDLKAALLGVFLEEMNRYKSPWTCFSGALFPKKRVAWFRKFVEGKPIQLPLRFSSQQKDLPATPEKLTEDLVDLIVSLTTFQGALPQGAPTSPQLLNIYLSESGLIGKIEAFLDEHKIVDANPFMHAFEPSGGFSIYADDLTISSPRPISHKVINELIGLIEKNSPFRINRKKILYYDRRRIAPLVTGLRIITLEKSNSQLQAFLEQEERSRLLKPRELKNLKKKITNGKGIWTIEAARYPKRTIRRVRGLIHRAIREKDVATQGKLRSKVDGHIAALRAVYRDENALPNQVAIPYEKYKAYFQNN